MQEREVVLCQPVRTAIGAYNGSLKAVPATGLGAVVIRETVRRSGIDLARIGSVVMGNVIQAGNRMNPARQAAVNGGIPVAVPALTVNRVCGSGAQAIASAAQEIWLGHADAAIAGGMENMDQAPYLMGGGRWGYRMGDAQIYDSMLRDGLSDAFSGEHSGVGRPGQAQQCDARGPGSMGGAFAAALCSSAKGRPFRGGNRRGRSEGQEGSAGLRHGRSQPAGYYSGRARQAEAGVS